MPGQSVTLTEALPRSHYFLTVSRGARMRTFAVRPLLVHAGLAALSLLALVGLGSTLYVTFHDDLMAGLMARQSEMQYAYEERIEGLRRDLDRQAAQGRADQSKVDARVHDLFARQAQLETRASLVADLAGMAGRPATASPARSAALPVEITGRVPALPAAALGYAASEKPHPLSEPALPGPTPSDRREDHASLVDDAAIPIAGRLTAADLALDRVERDQAGAVTSLRRSAQDKVARIRSLIEDSGLSPDRYLKTAQGPAAAMGGPFVPLPDPDAAFGRSVAELRDTLASASMLAGAVARLPVAAPLAGRPEVTSPFGARVDPFLGRAALHTGVDLRETFGSDIHATAAGRVVFAGVAGGYGNMVEVDHGNGVSTRYAHMGQIGVSEGQSVERGAILGLVGATGRATGPHLHYEVRIDGEPVDPMRFIQTGERATVAGLFPGR